MIVATIDQRASRRRADLVDQLLHRLNTDYPLVRPFERTAGDELQGVLDDGAAAVALALDVAATRAWSIGLGIGPVRLPLPPQTRAGAGPAFENARTAVERAKHSPASLAVVGPAPEGSRLEAELQLVAELEVRRSPAAAEAGRLIEQGLSQREAAERLGITQQAVSGRLAAGLWQPTRALLREAGAALGRLSESADAAGEPDGGAA
ncbi:helix-turn-helix domain-containing protein [Arthrobacter ginkgonis]|uniref:helix-turn-helix domain-containing protein n=1 Tax=Arthrobacter ginkgonis TaxID=1630594 RepID=UPI0031E799D0